MNFLLPTISKLSILFFVNLMIISCNSKIILTPDKGVQRSAVLQDAVLVSSSGVRLMIESGVWSGPENDCRKIIPIRFTIDNNSGRALIIRYSDFFICSTESGNEYSALPPYYFDSSFDMSLAVLPNIISFQPQFEYINFFSAPYCARMYSNIPQWREPFLIDYEYYQNFYPLWAKKRLLSFNCLIQSELPEGVLLNNGHLCGFVYFEALKNGEKKVVINFRLRDIKKGFVIKTISIPFNVHSR